MNRHALILTGLLLAFTITAAGAQWHPLSELRITEDLDMEGFDILDLGTLGPVDNTSRVDNLNADMVDGQDGSYYLDDTNAQTICSGSRALMGDGSCTSLDGKYLPADPATSNVDMNGNQVNNVGAPTSSNDAATKAYVDAAGSSGTGPVVTTHCTTASGTGSDVDAPDPDPLACPSGYTETSFETGATGNPNKIRHYSSGSGFLGERSLVNHQSATDTCDVSADVNFDGTTLASASAYYSNYNTNPISCDVECAYRICVPS